MKGRNNSLAKQVGEHLVCAELGRRDFIATPFAGNVPTFDVLAADEQCRTVPIQVKATRGKNWLTDIRRWLNLEYNPNTGEQKYLEPMALANPQLVYVCVVIASPGGRDRFFVLTQADIQKVIIASYSDWMERHDWKRPRKGDSYHCTYNIHDLAPFEDKWDLIGKQLQTVASEGVVGDEEGG